MADIAKNQIYSPSSTALRAKRAAEIAVQKAKEAAEAALIKEQFGIQEVDVEWGKGRIVNVVFPKPFAHLPFVFIQPQDGLPTEVSIHHMMISRTSAGFTFKIEHHIPDEDVPAGGPIKVSVPWYALVPH